MAFAATSSSISRLAFSSIQRLVFQYSLRPCAFFTSEALNSIQSSHKSEAQSSTKRSRHTPYSSSITNLEDALSGLDNVVSEQRNSSSSSALPAHNNTPPSVVSSYFPMANTRLSSLSIPSSISRSDLMQLQSTQLIDPNSNPEESVHFIKLSLAFAQQFRASRKLDIITELETIHASLSALSTSLQLCTLLLDPSSSSLSLLPPSTLNDLNHCMRIIMSRFNQLTIPSSATKSTSELLRVARQLDAIYGVLMEHALIMADPQQALSLFEKANSRISSLCSSSSSSSSSFIFPLSHQLHALKFIANLSIFSIPFAADPSPLHFEHYLNHIHPVSVVAKLFQDKDNQKPHHSNPSMATIQAVFQIGSLMPGPLSEIPEEIVKKRKRFRQKISLRLMQGDDSFDGNGQFGPKDLLKTVLLLRSCPLVSCLDSFLQNLRGDISRASSASAFPLSQTQFESLCRLCSKFLFASPSLQQLHDLYHYHSITAARPSSPSSSSSLFSSLKSICDLLSTSPSSLTWSSSCQESEFAFQLSLGNTTPLLTSLASFLSSASSSSSPPSSRAISSSLTELYMIAANQQGQAKSVLDLRDVLTSSSSSCSASISTQCILAYKSLEMWPQMHQTLLSCVASGTTNELMFAAAVQATARHDFAQAVSYVEMAHKSGVCSLQLLSLAAILGSSSSCADIVPLYRRLLKCGGTQFSHALPSLISSASSALLGLNAEGINNKSKSSSSSSSIASSFEQEDEDQFAESNLAQAPSSPPQRRPQQHGKSVGGHIDHQWAQEIVEQVLPAESPFPTTVQEFNDVLLHCAHNGWRLSVRKMIAYMRCVALVQPDTESFNILLGCLMTANELAQAADLYHDMVSSLLESQKQGQSNTKPPVAPRLVTHRQLRAALGGSDSANSAVQPANERTFEIALFTFVQRGDAWGCSEVIQDMQRAQVWFSPFVRNARLWALVHQGSHPEHVLPAVEHDAMNDLELEPFAEEAIRKWLKDERHTADTLKRATFVIRKKYPHVLKSTQMSIDE